MKATAEHAASELMARIAASLGELLVACSPQTSTAGLRDNDPEIDRRLSAQDEIRDLISFLRDTSVIVP